MKVHMHLLNTYHACMKCISCNRFDSALSFTFIFRRFTWIKVFITTNHSHITSHLIMMDAASSPYTIPIHTYFSIICFGNGKIPCYSGPSAWWRIHVGYLGILIAMSDIHLTNHQHHLQWSRQWVSTVTKGNFFNSLIFNYKRMIKL